MQAIPQWPCGNVPASYYSMHYYPIEVLKRSRALLEAQAIGHSSATLRVLHGQPVEKGLCEVKGWVGMINQKHCGG